MTPTQEGLTFNPATLQYSGTTPASPQAQTQQYQGYSNFVKSGASTWVLTYGTGGGLADQNWNILQGTLQGDTNSIRGASITDAGTLAFVQDFDGTFAGNVQDGATPGALAKGGTGTLTLTGTNTYSGGTFFNGGAILVASDANLGSPNGGLTFDGGTLRYGCGFQSWPQHAPSRSTPAAALSTPTASIQGSRKPLPGSAASRRPVPGRCCSPAPKAMPV